MNIIIIGGNGTIGQAVVKELSERHQIITASSKHGDVNVDIADPQSIEKMYQFAQKKWGSDIDAVVNTVGKVHFDDLVNMTAENYHKGLNNKLMGQVNLVLMGLRYLKPTGSFTLISGILNQDPIRGGTNAAMVNGALEAFVKAAAFEMPHKIRINLVSPTIVEESREEYKDFFRGYDAIPVAKAALAFSKSVEGIQTGQVYRVGY
jgi:NAD(P)-dependent dehydrogenase (short-subunit alcohol dehydrogenase family)